MNGAFALGVLATAIAFLTLTGLLPGVARRYYLLLPGGAFSVTERVRVPANLRQESGDLSLTVVYQRPATFPDALLQSARPGVRVVPYRAVIPVGQSEEESSRANRRLMDESQVSAAVVALKALGYAVGASGDGVRILSTLPGTPAAAQFIRDDVVTAIDGENVGTANEAVERIRRHRPGDAVSFSMRRGDQSLVVDLVTESTPGSPDQPRIGATIETINYRADLPIEVSIESGSVVGPSAGLMFALGIYDALTPGRLGGTHRIAGTGTIALDGRVGPVDGIAQKIVGAENAGYDVFLVPIAVEAEARRAARTIQVVPIRAFDDALAALTGM